MVRLHGYYTGASTATAGTTYVGYSPRVLYDSATDPAASDGQLTIPGSYPIQVAGAGGVPADGSATAVAVQVILRSPQCSGGFGLTPYGSSRTDWDGSFVAGADGEANFDLVAVPATAGGKLTLRLGGATQCASGGSSGQVAVRIVARGYFTAPTYSTPGSSYTPVTELLLNTATAAGTVVAGSSSAGCSASAPIPAHGGCTFQAGGVGAIPTSGVAGIAAEVLASGGATSGGSVVLTNAATGSLTATTFYASDGRYANFEVATYAGVSADGTLYVYNTGDDPVDVIVRAHGYYRLPQAPDQPADVSASLAPAGSDAAFSWRPATGDGGAAVTGYRLVADSGTGSPIDTLTSPAATSGALHGLTPGTLYVLSVRTVNDVADSADGYPANYKPGSDLYPPDTASPAPLPSESPSPAPTGPITLTGRILLPNGTPAAGYTVNIEAAMDTDLPVPLGTATTDSTGTFRYTPPTTSALPDAVRQAVDANNGVLNVIADAIGHVNNTSYTTAAVVGAALGVGTSDGMLTVQAVGARADLARNTPQATLLISNEVSSQPDSNALAGGEATYYTGADTAEEQASADSASTEWQSATHLSAGGYNPMRVGGTDYTASPQSPGPAPDSTPTGCHWGVDYRWVNPQSATRYSVVGEAHAYYDATASFSYSTSADSNISLGLSYDHGEDWKISGHVEVSNSISTKAEAGYTDHGPYYAKKWRSPFLYRSVDKQWRCTESSGSWHYWYTDIYSAAYHIPPASPPGKYGEDVRFNDGPRAYGYASRTQRMLL